MKFYFDFLGRALLHYGLIYAGAPAALAAAAAAAMAVAEEIKKAAFKVLMGSGKQISEIRASIL